MSRKQTRHFDPKVQRPVTYCPKQVQRCIDKSGYVIVQRKYDGIRALVVVQPNMSAKAYTRNGILIQALTGYLSDPLNVRSLVGGNCTETTVLDCEVWLSNLTFEEASGILRKKQDGTDGNPVCLRPFDRVSMPELLGTEQSPRLFSRLTQMSGEADAGYLVAETVDAVEAFYRQCIDAGYEGAVVKDPNQRYTGGKVQGWWKMKPSITAGGSIIGFVEGSKSNAGKLVGFLVELEDGTQCKATGLSQELIQGITERPELYISRAVEVEAMERTSKGNLRHPKFTRFRDAFERGTES